MLKPHERLYFLHIPKAAGNTLASILHYQFQPNEICPYSFVRELLARPANHLQNYRLLHGHFGLYPHRLLPEEPVTITMLRHPVDRVVSLYYFWRKWATDWLKRFPDEQTIFEEKIQKAYDFDLESFVHDPDLARASVNGQCYWLTVRDAASRMEPADSESRLEQAKYQLEKCAAFGFVERFDESVEVFLRTFGWKLPPHFQKRNVNPERPAYHDLPPSTIRAIEKLNELDFELYTYAEELFQKRYGNDKNQVYSVPSAAPQKETPSENVMPNERVIEIPWVLQNLPQSGVILDVGSCDATYLATIPQNDRILHAIDPQDCAGRLPPRVIFHQESIIGNSLPDHYFDVVLVLSTLEHIGLPTYGQSGFPDGDRLTLAEVRRLLKPGCPALITVPVGQSRVTSWYRQYSPDDLRSLFEGWQTEIVYWGYDGRAFVEVTEADVWQYDYRDGWQKGAAASAIACIIAYPLSP